MDKEAALELILREVRRLAADIAVGIITNPGGVSVAGQLIKEAADAALERLLGSNTDDRALLEWLAARQEEQGAA